MRSSGIEWMRARLDTGWRGLITPGASGPPIAALRVAMPALPCVSIHAAATVAILALALSGCKTIRTTDFIATPADRLVCEAAGPRPTIPTEPTIDWAHIATVAQAQVAHDDFVKVVHGREGIVTNYLLTVEGKLYTCRANMLWRQQYETELAKSHAAIQP